MSRGFGSTYGAGSTDVLATSFNTLPTGIYSRAIWAYMNGTGGGGLGRMFDASANTTANDSFFVFDSTHIAYGRAFTTIAGTWTLVTPATGSWHHYAVTYDSTSTANDANLYLDGVLQAVVHTQPSGTRVDTGNSYYIGNRQSSGNRGWDGMLAHMTLWNNIMLSQVEITALAAGANPQTIRPDSISCYMPLDGVNNPECDMMPNAPVGTQTGTHLGVSDPPVQAIRGDMFDPEIFPYMRSWNGQNMYFDHFVAGIG
jgi:hypothetical protein